MDLDGVAVSAHMVCYILDEWPGAVEMTPYHPMNSAWSMMAVKALVHRQRYKALGLPDRKSGMIVTADLVYKMAGDRIAMMYPCFGSDCWLVCLGIEFASYVPVDYPDNHS